MAKSGAKKKWNELPLIARAGIVTLGAYGLYRLIRMGVNQQPSLSKVEYDLSEIPEGWTPNKIANRLYDAMHGTQVDPTSHDRYDAWNSLSDLNSDQIRWLHNYWIGPHVPNDGDTLWGWINEEKVVDIPMVDDEADAKSRATWRMKVAGVKF
jgi:hypothetical protein